MRRYASKKPYFTTARFDSVCAETGERIKKGDEIAYFPDERKAYSASSKAAEQVRALNFASTFCMADADW